MACAPAGLVLDPRDRTRAGGPALDRDRACAEGAANQAAGPQSLGSTPPSRHADGAAPITPFSTGLGVHPPRRPVWTVDGATHWRWPSRCEPFPLAGLGDSRGGGTTSAPGRRSGGVALEPRCRGWRSAGADGGPRRTQAVAASGVRAPQNKRAERARCSLHEDLHDQPKRRRARKHKSKKSFKNPNNDHAEQAELKKQQSLSQEKLQLRPTDGPTISKNKKRKLKKKQQMKRKKAAGLLTTASGRNFMYQPEEGDSEQEALRESDGEDAADHGEDAADHGEDAADHGEDGADANEEDIKSTNEKADDILSFLKSTQEIYFYDGASKDADSAVSVEASQELFQHLEAHSMSPSDVRLVHHMKTLLLVRDTESLQHALERFPACCTMPPDHARVLSAFFNYWITHILLEKHSE
ncbi:PREDICTED: glutamate-rich protein 1 [Odobenus rosmarus divergens]|uniref:Glutamate-rich protein 1 n=1 Tax=Odobenus rosmarus divergens TaxID=9708 RepID=A0A9B0HD15_ODORO